jgi:type IV pilus assembly protein PilC
MLIYTYKAKDPATGQEITAEMSADNEGVVAKLLSEQGLAPIEIRLKKSDRSLFAWRNRVRSKERVLFSRQLSTLLNAGLPLVQSLRTVADQMTNKEFVGTISKIINDVESGSSLGKALKKYPKVFNNVYISLVAAGEASGTLNEALERLADQQEKDAEVVSKVRGAMIYPIIVIAVIIVVIGFLLVTVLPQVEQLYVDLGQKLPITTRAMLAVSGFVINFWWLALLLLVGAVWALKTYIQTESGRSQLDRLKMRFPIFGRLFMKMYMARFTRTGQTLMASGVPMLDMMTITANAVSNVHIKKTLDGAQAKVKAGITLSSSIKDSRNFLPLVPQMIAIGEQSGAIDTMMGKAATYYENDLDREIKAISTIIEPALMVILAIVTGVIVAAILLPIYGLVGQNLGGASPGT